MCSSGSDVALFGGRVGLGLKFSLNTIPKSTLILTLSRSPTATLEPNTQTSSQLKAKKQDCTCLPSVRFRIIFKSQHLIHHICLCRQDGAPCDPEVTEEAAPPAIQEAEDAAGGATEVSWALVKLPRLLLRVSHLMFVQQDAMEQEASGQLPEGEEPSSSGMDTRLLITRFFFMC